MQNHTPVTIVRCASRECNRRDRECTQTGNDKQVHSQHVREGKRICMVGRFRKPFFTPNDSRKGFEEVHVRREETEKQE